MAPRRGLEPPTLRLTAECSTIELPRNILFLEEVLSFFKEINWQLPTLPASHPASTISVAGLNLRVRNGNGCIPCAIATKFNPSSRANASSKHLVVCFANYTDNQINQFPENCTAKFLIKDQALDLLVLIS